MLGRAPRAFREQLIAGVDDAGGVVVLDHVVVDVDLVVCQRDHAAAGRHVADAVAQRRGLQEKLSHALPRSEEHTSELQSLMRISYAVFCLKKKKQKHTTTTHKGR